MRDTLAQATTSSETQLRAYVGFEGARFKLLDPERTIPTASVGIKNFGLTPATEVTHYGRLIVGPRRDDAVFVEPAQRPLDAMSAVLSPQQTMYKLVGLCGPSGQARPLTREEIVDLTHGDSLIYVYGVVTYLDSFNRRQTSRYRMMYLSVPLTATLEGGADLAYCAKGNEIT